ncbi:MAG: O-antigen ligase family protein [Opitutae bacterium]|nr:O-antigen ligase family protein [Opitutae bacterium]MBT5716349.1 O-antigen ligase family protein [Opitutae bacterium]
MNKLTTKVLIVLLVVVSWAKAGLAGNWILYTINLFILASLLFLFVSKENIRLRLLLILPIALICLLFSLSYTNPSFTVINNSGWAKLNIDKYFTHETDIEKIIMVSEIFKDIKILSKKKPELAHAIFWDFKKRFFDKYPNHKGPMAKLILEYDKIIQLKANRLIPSSALSNKGLLIEFINKISQTLIGIILFLCINNRKIIRNIFLIISINIGVLAIVGVFQKLNYAPSDEQLEIFGIWNTPEPRYFFSSFTYKNHWSAFALMGLCTSLGLLVDSYRRYGKSFTKKTSNLLLFLSVLSIVISIPLSGSRSGTILMILSFILLSFMTLSFFSIFSLKLLCIFSFSIFMGAFVLYSFVSKINEETINEMTSNFKAQYDEISNGKLPLRMLLWKDLLEQIQSRPVYGFGFNSYKTINPIYQSLEVRNMRRIGLKAAHQKYTPLVGTAHNDWLEKISEFGLVGLLIVCPYLYFIFIQFFKTNSLLSKFGLFGAIIFLIYSFGDFPSQTPACLMLFSTLVGLALKYGYVSPKKVLA